MTKPIVLITGVGEGTGAALARCFAAGGYRVAMLAGLTIPVRIAINPAQVVPKGPALDLDRPHRCMIQVCRTDEDDESRCYS